MAATFRRMTLVPKRIDTSVSILHDLLRSLHQLKFCSRRLLGPVSVMQGMLFSPAIRVEIARKWPCTNASANFQHTFSECSSSKLRVIVNLSPKRQLASNCTQIHNVLDTIFARTSLQVAKSDAGLFIQATISQLATPIQKQEAQGRGKELRQEQECAIQAFNIVPEITWGPT
jgi:hypothetical protein